MSRRVYFGLYGTFYLAIDHSIIAFYCSTAKPFYTTTKICRKKVFASLIVTRSRSFSKKVFWYLFCSCFVVLDYFIIISLSRTCNLRFFMLNLLVLNFLIYEYRLYKHWIITKNILNISNSVMRIRGQKCYGYVSWCIAHWSLSLLAEW